MKVGPERTGSASPGLLEQLGRNILQTAQGGSKNAGALVFKISEGGEKWPYHFIRGLVFECFVDDQQKFRLKSRHLTRALLAGVRGCSSDSLPIFDELIHTVETSELKGGVTLFRNDYAQAADRCRGAVERLKTDEAHFADPIERLIAELDRRREATPEDTADDNIPF